MSRYTLVLLLVLIILVLETATSTHANDQYITSKQTAAVTEHAHSASDIDALLSDLQTAYFAETVENEEYAAYAEKAEEEGYISVANLFQALSVAEKIHATKRAIIIHQLGDVPEKPSEPIIVESTVQNLHSAIDAETYEQSFMYPSYIANAKNASMHASFETMVVSFYNYCLKAESVHLNLLQDAEKNMNDSDGNPASFLVCPRCGCIQSTEDFKFCTMCAIPKEDFVQVG